MYTLEQTTVDTISTVLLYDEFITSSLLHFMHSNLQIETLELLLKSAMRQHISPCSCVGVPFAYVGMEQMQNIVSISRHDIRVRTVFVG